MKINIIILLIYILQWIACTPPKSQPAARISIMEELQLDLANGKISNDDYYTFLTYSVFAQDLLPKNYKGKIGPRDATPVIRKVQRSFSTLSPATQEHLKQWIKPLPPKPKRPGVKP